MTFEEFHNLQHGNVIKDEMGDLFLALNPMRNEDGKVVHIGLMPAICVADAKRFEIVSPDYQVTHLAGRTVNL